MHRILCATDFSRPSLAALEVAAALAQAHHAELLLLHVVPSLYPVCAGGATGMDPQPDVTEGELRGYREEMRAKLLQLKIPDAKVGLEHVLREGDVAAGILRAAQEKACDLIVMGTHGQTASEHALMGSVAEEVARKAPCPVLTLRNPL
jgi:nucleotide-binding universal stress UspA family protein